MTDKFLMGWTSERVTSIAPDSASVLAGKKLAVPRKWLTLGRDEYTIWGEFAGSASTPYQVKIDLLKLHKGELALACTCPSRKQPCKHSLALLYISVEQPSAILAFAAPPFVQEWLDKTAQRVRKQQEKKKRDDKTADPEQLSKTFEERKAKITAGLEDLELWLENLIRHGLGDSQIKQYAFWDSKAARMVDAQAPGIATWLRDMAGIPVKGMHWVEELLDQLSRLYLVIEGFKRFDQLSPELQADLRAVVGWHMKREELLGGNSLLDHWLVIGHHIDRMDEQLRRQRLWLRGKETGQEALILEFAFGDQPFDTLLQTGLSVYAEMIFYPSQYPLRGFIARQTGDPKPGSIPTTATTIQVSIEKYAAAVAKNPFLSSFPLLLQAVVPTPYAGKWIAREEGGTYLPIASKFQHKWSLMALGGGNPIQVAGEWDGQEFLPTGAILSNRFIDFNLVGKL